MSYDFTDDEIKRGFHPSGNIWVICLNCSRPVSLASCRLMRQSHPSRSRAKGLNYTKCKNQRA